MSGHLKRLAREISMGQRANSQRILKVANAMLVLGHAWAIDGP